MDVRKWVSPATCLYIINFLLPSKDDASLLMSYDICFIPISNPDGYFFSSIDINRNFEINHCGEKDYKLLCNDKFLGFQRFPKTKLDQFEIS
ncbi:carboxypeptidase B-like protein [Leptotrombidium deliense]|uniref:Carboxypeptidase B-like protein n=1 Tax=Leptotrombidium deliense TaxID=299467 RepID=A0A443S3B5_9ACAR|nr:carboxypeptidase B-like protein [Leptotrombidium deliense]